MKRMDLKVIIVIAVALTTTVMSCVYKKPNDKVVCGNDTYVFRIGEISVDKNTNTTTVSLLTDQSIRIKASFSTNSLNGGNISNYNAVSPVKMKIVTGQRTVECNNNIMLSSNAITFTFNTSVTPDKIIVYSNDNNKSTVAYDGKTKGITSVD